MSIDPNTGLPATPKKGMSGCMKAFLILGIVGVVLGVGCCGGFYFFGGGNPIKVNTDPAQAAKVGDTIFDGGLGEDFPAKTSVVISIPFVGPFMSMVIYGDEAAGEMVMVGQLDPKFTQGANKAQMEQQMRDAMSQQANKGNMTVLSTSTKPVTIRGKPTEAVISKVKTNDGKEGWMATASFEGKGGQAFLMVMVPANEYEEADVVEVIELVK